MEQAAAAQDAQKAAWAEIIVGATIVIRASVVGSYFPRRVGDFLRGPDLVAELLFLALVGVGMVVLGAGGALGDRVVGAVAPLVLGHSPDQGGQQHQCAEAPEDFRCKHGDLLAGSNAPGGRGVRPTTPPRPPPPPPHPPCP